MRLIKLWLHGQGIALALHNAAVADMYYVDASGSATGLDAASAFPTISKAAELGRPVTPLSWRLGSTLKMFW